MNLIQPIFRQAAARPLIAFTVACCLTAICATGLPRLRIDPGIDGLVPNQTTDYAAYRKTVDTYGSDLLQLVAVTADDLFARKTLESLDDLTIALANLPGVERVRSLTNANHIRGEDAFLYAGPFLEFLPDSAAASAELARRATSDPLIRDTFLGTRPGSTAIFIFLDEAAIDAAGLSTIAVKGSIDEVLDSFRGKAAIYQVGIASFEAEVARAIAADLRLLIPLAVAMIALVFAFFFRSVRILLFPLVTSGLAILATLGLMGWLGLELNPMTVMVPLLIIVIGSTEDVHIASEYFRVLRKTLRHDQAMEAVIHKMPIAVLMTAATTVSAFLILLVNPIPMLRDFGLCAAIGLAINFATTLLSAPTMLFLAGKGAERKRAHFGSLEAFFRRAIGSYRVTFVASFFLAALGIAALTQVRVDTDFLEFFRKSAPVRQQTIDAAQTFGGSQSMIAVLTSPHPGFFQLPDILRKTASLDTYIEQTIGPSSSLADHIVHIYREDTPGAGDGAYPPDEATIAQYMLLVDRDELTRFGAPDRSTQVFYIRTPETGSATVTAFETLLKTRVAELFGADVSIHLTGKSVLVAHTAQQMSRDVLVSMTMAIVIFFGMMFALFRDIRIAAIALIPNLIPVISVFAAMGILDIPVNTGTFSVAMIALGIAADDTIHFFARFHIERQAGGHIGSILARVIEAECHPVFTTSAGLAAGFGLLIASAFNTTAEFGILSAIAMLTALAADLFLTPAILRFIPLKDV